MMAAIIATETITPAVISGLMNNPLAAKMNNGVPPISAENKKAS